MIDASLRDLVRERARHRCEYCGLRQDLVPIVAFHVEHIVPRQHGGASDPGNLALACYHCNLHKGPNLAGIDPDTQSVALLFNPRSDVWEQHFSSNGALLIGLTPTGRATVHVLAMNAPSRVELRIELHLA